MTAPPPLRWPGGQELAERYAALRHPALARVRVAGDTGETAGPVVVETAATADLPALSAAAAPDSTTVLRAAGEVALGLDALHGLGLAHGNVSATAIRRDGDRWILTGVAAPGDAAARTGDLSALAATVRAALGDAAGQQPRIAEWLTQLTGATRPAADLGRAALSLAAGAAAPEPPIAPAPARAALSGSEESAEFAARRRRARNRLIVVGAVVVVGGALLLRHIDSHGIVRVPDEVGRPQPAASHALVQSGLLPRARRAATRPAGVTPGTVTGQSPAAGQRVRPGRTVVITVAPGATAPSGSSDGG